MRRPFPPRRRPSLPANPGRIDRRRFLHLTAAFGLTLGCGRLDARLPSGLGPTQDPQRVLVIGAGISGLAAARTLADAGHDVLVIEARDRIGGRINTSGQWADAPVDLGASWIHGTNNNPIAQIASDISAQTMVTDEDAYEGFGVTGAPLTFLEELRLLQLQNQMNQAVQDGQDAVVDRPLYDTLTEGIDYNNLSLADQQLSGLLMNAIELGTSGSLHDLSTYWFDDGEDFGGDEVVFPSGYRVITDHLAKGLAIELGQTVTRVEVTTNGVSVTTSEAIFTGDRAVVTLPLGVLQAGSVTFEPGLPASMQQALNGLEMGLLNKAYLRFPSTFWPSEPDFFAHVPDDYGQWSNWLNIERAVGQPILMAFNAADFGRQIEAWTDQDIVAAGMDHLRSIFGNGIPDPTDFQITRWASDPFSWGSYSFITTGADPSLRDDLGGNIEQRVFFAGEATNRQYYATVHGAYLSGLDAAAKVEAAGQVFSDGFESGDASAWSAQISG